MIYELRIYRCMPGRLAIAIPLPERRLADLGKARHPPSGVLDHADRQEQPGDNLHARLDNMAEREKLWQAFLTDPEWIAVATETEKYGQLVENISCQLLAPAAFSAVK
jgi:hypothetical protein